IDTIQNTRQTARLCKGIHQTIQAAAIFRRPDLTGIGLTDGTDAVCIHQPALHKAPPAVKLEAVNIVKRVRQSRTGPFTAVEIALIGQIVDGKQGGCTADYRVVAVDGTSQDRYQTALPVVAMEYVGLPSIGQAPQRFQHRIAKEDVRL